MEKSSSDTSLQMPQTGPQPEAIPPQIDNDQSPIVAQPQKPQAKPKHVVKLVFIILFVLLLGIIGAFVFTQVYHRNNNSKNTVAGTPTIRPQSALIDTPSPEPASTESAHIFSETYTSNKLGVTFTYAPEYAGYKAFVKEDGNKIYVGPEFDLSEFIQVFTVEHGTSVAEDMQYRFLSNYSSKDCRITGPTKPNDPKNGTGAFPINQNFRILDIEANVNYEALPDLDALAAALQKCPAGYTRSNSVTYFAYDTKMPTKYIFYSIGQDPAWPANSDPNAPDKNLTWIQTINFIDK